MDVPVNQSSRSKQAIASKGKTRDKDGDSGGEGHKSPAKVAHTLTACCRCRHRKTRCDAGLPRCGPCERSNAACEYFDSTKGKNISRTYVIHLQNRVQALERELSQISQNQRENQDVEALMRGAGLVRFKENDESRFLGPSSGINMTRLVMDLAKQNSNAESIKEIVPEKKAQQIRERFTKESSKPTSKVYPLISSVAAPALPTRDLTQRLVENFNQKAQYLLPLLHEPSFQEAVHDVYQGSKNPYKNFALRLVIAISMQKLDTQFAGLADSYYLAALPFLEDAIRPMDLGTLQCFALIAQYSLLTPTRTASYWVVGLATRLCQELGITDESTITSNASGTPINALEVDLRRRLFWIITSMELGLSHSLGRPSAFAATHDHINVGFFATVDDRFITSSGILPGSPPSMKKLLAIHFFKMRLLQAEIRRKLYLKKRGVPKNDQDPWFVHMEDKLKHWQNTSPRNDEGSGLSKIWFTARYNTILIFLYRPSPQVPEPSLRAASLCFEAAKFNLNLQLEQIRKRMVDLTWIFTQSLFMALNTILWTLSYPEIRKEHPRAEVETLLQTAQVAIFLSSERWPGVESALELYDTLIQACLRAYDGNHEKSYIISSPANKPAPGSPQEIATPPQLSTPSTVNSSLSSTRNGPESNRGSPFGYGTKHNLQTQAQSFSSPTHPISLRPLSQESTYFQEYPPAQSIYSSSPSYQDIAFDPTSLYNPLPSPLEHGSRSEMLQETLYSQAERQTYYLGSIGDQYSQYLHAQFIPQEPLESLDMEQQLELMNTLETGGLTTIMEPTTQTSNLYHYPGYVG